MLGNISHSGKLADLARFGQAMLLQHFQWCHLELQVSPGRTLKSHQTSISSDSSMKGKIQCLVICLSFDHSLIENAQEGKSGSSRNHGTSLTEKDLRSSMTNTSSFIPTASNQQPAN